MSTSVEETAGLLARVGVFSELAQPELEHVAEVAVPRSFAGGEVVFREGDESNTTYIVRAGHARAVRQHSDGRVLTLANFGPGEVFGELAMFDSDRRSATIPSKPCRAASPPCSPSSCATPRARAPATRTC